MGDIEDDGAVAVRDWRRAGEKRLRRIGATMAGNAIGLPAFGSLDVMRCCDG